MRGDLSNCDIKNDLESPLKVTVPLDIIFITKEIMLMRHWATNVWHQLLQLKTVCRNAILVDASSCLFISSLVNISQRVRELSCDKRTQTQYRFCLCN